MNARTLILSLLCAVTTSAWAEYPDRQITIVVPFAAGGPTDKVARDFAEALRKPMGGATIVVENVGGAGGNLGAAKVAKAAPDGYTLLLHNIALATAPALYRSLSYKPLEDFEPLGLIAEVPMTLLGRRDFAPTSLADIVKLGVAQPGELTLGHAGIGSAAHLCGLLLQSTLKVDLLSVPYKGTAPAMTDLLGGQIDLMCDQTTNTTPQIAANKVKAYGVSTPRRLSTPALAALPTLDEAGAKGFAVAVWHGLYAPKGTPMATIEKLNAALKAALKDTEFDKRQEALGSVVVTDARTGRAEHRAFVAAETRRWEPVIKAAGQYAD